MVQGLAFLSKKSWHTSKLCNQEKVWIAEQEKAAEDIKIKELAKQIQQEREEEELNRISGKKSNRLDRGIDWMYQGGGVGNDNQTTAFEEEQKEKEKEEYLLGKEYNPSNVKKGDLASAESSVGVNMIITRAAVSASASASSANNTAGVAAGSGQAERNDTQDWNSNFHLRHEDPMFLVEQQRKEKKRDEEKKRQLFDSVNDDENDRRFGRRDRDRGRDRDGNGSDRNTLKSEKTRSRRHDYDDDRDRSERKKRKKEKRHDERRRRSCSSESDDARRHHRRDRKHRQRRRKRSVSRSVSRSRSPSPRKSRDYRPSGESSRRSKHDDERHRRDRSRSRSRSRSRDRAQRDRNNSRERRYRHDAGKDDERHNDERHNRESAEDKPKGYGLIGSSASKPLAKDIGPDQSLLAKKRQEKQEARGPYKRRGDSTRHELDRKPSMTEEEREAALRAMQSDASLRSSHISSAKRTSNAELYEEEIQRRQKGGSGNASASFLRDARHSHGVGHEDQSLTSRVSQNRNRHQRSTDDTFL